MDREERVQGNAGENINKSLSASSTRSGISNANVKEGGEFGSGNEDLKKRRGTTTRAPGRCHSCNRAETPEWRRGPDGARTLCNQCGLHYAKLVGKQASNNATSMSSKPVQKSHHDSMETREDTMPSQNTEPENWILSRTNHSTEDPDIGFIETLYRCCSAAFLSLWKLKFRFTTHFRQKNILKMDVASLQLWKESFTSGQLDTVLQESSPLRISVVENLEAIGNFLLFYLRPQDGIFELPQHDKNILVDLTYELEAQLEKSSILISIKESTESSSDEESDESSSGIERQRNNFGRLHSYVRCLMDLAPAIENHVKRLENQFDELPLPSGSVFNPGHSAQPFAIHIHDRFQDIRSSLVDRLAKANWERFVRIRRLTGPIEDVIPSPDSKPDAGLQNPVSSPCVPDVLGINTPTSRFPISAIEDDQGRLRVPPPPREIGVSFQCDYCRMMVRMKDRSQWKKHVFGDLKPYICTQSDCDESLETFATRELWANHEFDKHLEISQWHCFRCTWSTSTRPLLVRHLYQRHGGAAYGRFFQDMVTDSRETLLKPDFINHPCALCLKTGWETKEEYISHVGNHLEEISLVCLPLGGEGQEENEDNHDTLKTGTAGDDIGTIRYDDDGGRTIARTVSSAYGSSVEECEAS